MGRIYMLINFYDDGDDVLLFTSIYASLSGNQQETTQIPS